MCRVVERVQVGFWRWRVADVLRVKAAPWPLRADAHIFDVVLVVISGFAVQQIGGQLWRVFCTRIPEQACALLVLLSKSNAPCNAYITSSLCKVQLITAVMP